MRGGQEEREDDHHAGPAATRCHRDHDAHQESRSREGTGVDLSPSNRTKINHRAGGQGYRSGVKGYGKTEILPALYSITPCFIHISGGKTYSSA